MEPGSVSIPPLTPFPAAVIGGGISGLACAYRLQQAGVPVRVLEAASRGGGLIQTVEEDGFRFESGPQSFLSNQALLTLIERLGLQEELLRADPRAPRYILLRGKLVPAPLAPPSLLTTRLFGLGTKWRLLTEMFRHAQPPAGDESIASFVRRKFGEELLDRVVAPFVSGIYAGDPEKLSLRAAFPKLHEFEQKYGSVARGAMKSRQARETPRPGLCSFREGVETLPRALAARLGDAVLTQTSVTGLRRGKTNGKSWFELVLARRHHAETMTASAVIVAAPSAIAADLLKGISESLAESLSRIEYARVAVVAAGYRRDQIEHGVNGFGFLVPRSEGLRVLGTVWNSSLFPGRAPEGKACLTSFAGGATDPTACDLTDEKIADIVTAELARILHVTGAPMTLMAHRYERALPQYNLGHCQRVSSLTAAVSAVPGLFLTGNYLAGPSIGTCVEQANQAADAARVYLASIGIAGAREVAHA
jgi:protoporphyrinogen/coproporphyrinogen III oxidase